LFILKEKINDNKVTCNKADRVDGAQLVFYKYGMQVILIEFVVAIVKKWRNKYK